MNKIYRCNHMPNISEGYPVIIDGNTNRNSKTFLRTIGELLDFEDLDNSQTWGAYLNQMRDLSWLAVKSISIIIYNYEQFLLEESEVKRNFLLDMKKIIQNHWDMAAKDPAFNNDNLKEIQLYCMTGNIMYYEFMPTVIAYMGMEKDLIGNKQIPHSTSRPVIRMQDGVLYLAIFAFSYKKSQIENGMAERPWIWALADLQTGKLKFKYLCAEKDFSRASPLTLYSVSNDMVALRSPAYWKGVDDLLDMIRAAYLRTGKLPKDTYAQYMDRVLQTTPIEYRRFYLELSKTEWN